jgi:hypothetical protein
MTKQFGCSISRSFLFLLFLCGSAGGWYDETHLAVARAAGYLKWYNAAGADIAKLKAGDREKYNHFFNNTRNAKVTPGMVLSQVKRYDDPHDEEGHLYGAIIASLAEYRAEVARGAYAEYHLALTAHYVADLSQPFHNIPHDDFARRRHAANDGVVNAAVLDNVEGIERHMYPVSLTRDRFEEDLAREIARVANLARALGRRLRSEDRDMTAAEAYRQLGHSASLLRAILMQVKAGRESSGK